MSAEAASLPADSATSSAADPSAGAIAPQPGIMDIALYEAGASHLAGRSDALKLSSNENPWGCSPAAREAIIRAAAEVHRYPSSNHAALRAAIGEVHGLDPERIICGAGSDEIISFLAQAYAGPGTEVLFTEHGFLMYRIAAQAAGARPVAVRERERVTDVDALIAGAGPATRLIFVANPNNPTGSFLPKGEIARLHAGLPADVVLVVDQAYAEYLSPEDDDGALALAKTHSNVLVTRTFSKIYGLAGERIGWATGAPGLVDTLNRIRGPFNVSNSGQAMALAAIGDQAFVEHSRTENRKGREALGAELAALGNHGLRVLPSEANFLLVLFEGALSAETAYNGLAEAGYIVRWLPNQGLPQALRITIGAPEHMAAITATIRQLAEAAK